MLSTVELRTLFGKVGKGSVVVASSYAYHGKEKAMPGTAARCSTQIDIDK